MSSTELVSVEAAEKLCLEQPQVGCQVTHHFGPGVYLRVCTVPAGVFAISHRHRFAHTNVVLAGAVSMRQDDGPIHVVKAPHFYVAPPGRKMGLALQDLVWMNIFPTYETNVEQLEELLFDKSPAFQDLAAFVRAREGTDRETDRADFHAFLDEVGMSPYQARAESEREDDLVPFAQSWGVMVRPSAIEGNGIFSSVSLDTGNVICPARVDGKRTPAGRYANHSRNPSAKFVDFNGDAYLVATRPIAPFCSETVPGDEITVDYRQALSLAGRLR